MRLGILALQGDFDAHADCFRRLGQQVSLVRCPEDLAVAEALVFPGGESTTMLNFLGEGGFLDRLAEAATRIPVYATCAGMILLAREVLSPRQHSLGVLDIAVERNGYGRQIASFIDHLDPGGLAHLGRTGLEAVFIRAPRIVEIGPAVETILSRGAEPVLVRQGRILAASFHPELTPDDRVARYFLETVAAAGAPVAKGEVA